MKNFFKNGKKSERFGKVTGIRRRGLRLESLEDRLLLTAVPNGWGLLSEPVDGMVTPSHNAHLQIQVAGNEDAVFGVLVSAESGSDFNPGAISVRNASGTDVTAGSVLSRSLNYHGTSSLVILKLSAGDYKLVIAGENGSTGDFVCNVFLPGDTDGNRAVDSNEATQCSVYAAASDAYRSGNFNQGTILFYQSQFGIDITDGNSVYNARYDADMNGVIDSMDVSILHSDMNGAIKVELLDSFQITPINDSVTVEEGTSGVGVGALTSDSFSANIQDVDYRSNGFVVQQFTQTSLSSSSEISRTGDYSSFITFDDESGKFSFDATDSVFDSLQADETLTITFDYYLNNLTFDTYDEIYQNVKAGTVTVTVTGQNDAPTGAKEVNVSYELAAGTLSETVNLLAGVTDVDGDDLSARIVSATLLENAFEIATDADYSACFAVAADGGFSVERDSLTALLTRVPQGMSVTFSLDYQVADTHGVSIDEKITLTVIGQNDAPVGTAEIAAAYDLAVEGFSSPVNLLNDVEDPDSDALSVRITATVLQMNDYGIPADTDCSACFAVTPDGTLSVNHDSLASLLTAVPKGESVTFLIDYLVSDPSDTSLTGRVTLTVTGQNDAPATVDNPLTVTEAVAEDGSLVYQVDLAANLTDIDGDPLSVVSITIGEMDYLVANLASGVTRDGFTFRFDAGAQLLTVTVSPDKVEELRWAYSATDGNPTVCEFDYVFTDGTVSETAAAVLKLTPADDPAKIVSAPEDVIIFHNSGAAETDITPITNAGFLSDRHDYSVAVTVKNDAGETVNMGELAELLTVSISYTENAPGGMLAFFLNDDLANRLADDTVYSVSFALRHDGQTEAMGEFSLTVKPFQVTPREDSIAVIEGESGKSADELTQTGFTATINNEIYHSSSFVVASFEQLSAVSSLGVDRDGDYFSFITFDGESGKFSYDAADSVFDSLQTDETLTITFDYYLNDLTFTEYGETIHDVKGGTITVIVTGVNDAPVGAKEITAAYDLGTAVLSPTAHLLAGVTDADGDKLTASITKADVSVNPYGIDVSDDYASFFTIGEDGAFGVTERLASLLAAVPQGKTVTFVIDYRVTDLHGAFDAGKITLTVTGQNDAPTGAQNFVTDYDLATGDLSETVNILTGVSDVDDGDQLAGTLTAATLQANVFSIPTDVDYSDDFVIAPNGTFSVSESLTAKLAKVPKGETVIFLIDYAVSDESGAAIHGQITLTVTGQNDSPTGAKNYEEKFDLATNTLSTPINVLDGVHDPDGDDLTPTVTEAFLGENVYSIPTDVDYSDHFLIAADGTFTVRESLAALLAAVPVDQEVRFQIGYQIADPESAEADPASYTSGTVTLVVAGRNETPTGVADYSTDYDMATGDWGETVNLLNGVTDADGDKLTALITKADVSANPYGIDVSADYASCFTAGEDGTFGVTEGLASLVALLPVGKTITFTVHYQVADPSTATDDGQVTLTVTGCYEAPVFGDVKIDNVVGSMSGTASLDLSSYFSGTIKDYSVDVTGSSAILDSDDCWSFEGSTLTFHFLKTENYASKLDLSALSVVISATDGRGNVAQSNVFAVSLSEQYTSKISLAAVTTEFGGQDVEKLETRKTQFGTFYYTAGDAVPKTDYEAIALADEYYLEIWVQDVSCLITQQSKFLTSIQVQLNYDWNGGAISSLELEDLYAGKTALDSYLYYDDAETMLKALQVTWLYDDDLDWSRMEPITNGENAFLLARISVKANSVSSIELEATLTGVSEPESPFSSGWYYVRQGETAPLDSSQIKTVDIKAEKTSSITGAADAEYVVDHGVYVRAVTEKTATDADGMAASIGVNADFIHEWQTHYAEVWVKVSDAEGCAGASTNFQFDSTCFTVADVEFGDAFVNGVYDLDAAGTITGLSATAAGGSVTGDGYVLLARIRFESTGEQGVFWDHSLTPKTLEWKLSDAVVTTTQRIEIESYLGKNASTELWANPYDVNDDGVVDVADFVTFANEYGGDSLDHYAGMFLDFNRDGIINIEDFTGFANNYGLTRQAVVAGTKSLSFPETFTQRYVGSSFDADNTQLVGKILDAASQAWTDALGLDDSMTVTIAVKDFRTDELARAQVIETDASTGRTTRGVIYLDDDAAGHLWFSQLTSPSADSTRYDLYSVLLHELGHLYGYNAENVALTSVAGDFDFLGEDGHSTDAADVMFATLETGVRKSLTDHDVAVVSAIQTASATPTAVETILPVSFLAAAESQDGAVMVLPAASGDAIFSENVEFAAPLPIGTGFILSASDDEALGVMGLQIAEAAVIDPGKVLPILDWGFDDSGLEKEDGDTEDDFWLNNASESKEKASSDSLSIFTGDSFDPFD